MSVKGNRCGHQPSAPRIFEAPISHRARPKILITLGAVVMDYYNQPEKTLPSLNAANHSERRQRSERRESCLLLLRAVIHYTDLVTLKVGVPKSDGSIGGLTLQRLSCITGMGLRRTTRAMRDLKLAGILKVATRCRKTVEGEFRGEAAIKSLSPHVFAIFGLDRWLGHEQRRASERKDQRVRKRNRRARAQFRLVADSLLKMAVHPSAADSGKSSDRTQRAHHEFTKIRETLGISSSVIR